MLDFWIASKGGLNLVPTWPHAGAPSNGTSGTYAGIAGVGDLLVDTTNAVFYQNTGTTASPTWSSLSSGGSGITQITGAIAAGPGPGSVVASFGHGAVTAVAGAATLNSNAGIVTSEALTGATTYTLTLTNSQIVSTSVVLVTPYDGAATGVQVTSITVSTHQVVVVMAMAALTGTVAIPFAVFN